MNDWPAWITRALTPQPEDSADLRWAIETAAAMWSRGDRAQSVRWMHHAAHTAHAEGRQQRTADLARSAEALDRILRESTEPEPSASMKKTTPYQIAPDDITQLVPPDAQLLEQSAPSEQRAKIDTDPDFGGPTASRPAASAPSARARAERPRPPASVPDRETTMAAAGAPRKHADQTIVMPTFPDVDSTDQMPPPPGASLNISAPAPQSYEPAEQTRAYGSPDLASSGPTSPKQISSAPGTLESPPAPLEPMRAVRVAIQPGSGHRMTLIVLSEGQPAPQGAQEALLVPLGPARGSSGST